MLRYHIDILLLAGQRVREIWLQPGPRAAAAGQHGHAVRTEKRTAGLLQADAGQSIGCRHLEEHHEVAGLSRHVAHALLQGESGWRNSSNPVSIR